MRKIFLLLALFVVVNGFVPLQASSAENNNQSFLAIPTYKAIGYLTSHGFTLVRALQTDTTLFLTTQQNSDVTFLIHAPSSFSNMNFMSVQVLLSDFSLKPDSDPNRDSMNILTPNTFNLLAKSLAFLPCSNKENFLRNGFACPNLYKVQYTLHEGGLNRLRRWLGVVEDKQVIINIVPLK